jgi:uncharacterized membrane protein YvbJ
MECPSCGTSNLEEARFCQNCGHALGENAPPIPPEPNRIQTETLYIPPPPPNQGSPGVWTGVKLGCGMFIVLPILIIIGVTVLLALLAALGGGA